MVDLKVDLAVAIEINVCFSVNANRYICRMGNNNSMGITGKDCAERSRRCEIAGQLSVDVKAQVAGGGGSHSIVHVNCSQLVQKRICGKHAGKLALFFVSLPMQKGTAPFSALIP
jgi:hypothetical protein